MVLLVTMGLLGLTGCEKNDNKDADINSGAEANSIKDSEANNSVALELDFRHVNDKTYHAQVNISSDDKVTESDEEEPNFERIENETDNYVLDITLDTEAKEAYEQFKTSAKNENELYEEVKFGKYEGYYSEDDGIYGYILLDSSDSTFNVFINFNVYLFDDSSDSKDIQTIFHSSKIQDILNNVKFESSK